MLFEVLNQHVHTLSKHQASSIPYRPKSTHERAKEAAAPADKEERRKTTRHRLDGR
jgi:hypothetical protein